jgi:hypothetical protein
MLMCVKAPEAVMRGEHEITVPGVTSTAPNVETYGATIIREALSAMTGFQKAQAESPDRLVEAIAAARRAGMTDVAAELEKKLTGKALDGARPITGGPVTVESFLSPTPPALAATANGKKATS